VDQEAVNCTQLTLHGEDLLSTLYNDLK